MNKLNNPVPIFLDARGNLIDGGQIYVGTANTDPQVSPITVYWDLAGTIPAAQPLRTSGGYIVNNGQPAIAYVNASDYSMRLRDNSGAQIFYASSRVDTTNSFQPIDSDLTTIAGQNNTAYGLNLLTLPNQAALVSATGIPAPLPLTGGTVSGAIIRQGGGRYFHHVDPTIIGDSISRGTAAPSSGTDGDIYLQYTP